MTKTRWLELTRWGPHPIFKTLHVGKWSTKQTLRVPTIDWASSTAGCRLYSCRRGSKDDKNVDLSCCAAWKNKWEELKSLSLIFIHNSNSLKYLLKIQSWHHRSSQWRALVEGIAVTNWQKSSAWLVEVVVAVVTKQCSPRGLGPKWTLGSWTRSMSRYIGQKPMGQLKAHLTQYYTKGGSLCPDFWENKSVKILSFSW